MLFSLLIALSPHAHASTFYFSDIGVKGFARGGAFIAGVDDISAQWYNPAALTRVEKGMFGIQVSYVLHDVSFERAAEEDLTFDPIENDSRNTVIPHFGVAYRFGDLTTYFGFTSPYADFLEYPADGSQRYSLVESSVLQTFTGGVLAYKVNEWVSIGVGASWNMLEVNQSRNLSVYIKDSPASESEDPSSDVTFSLSVRDNFGVAYNLSTLIEPPSKTWAFGLMIQPPTNFDANGSVEADFSKHFLHTNGGIIVDPVSNDESVSMDIKMPLIIRTGFLVRPVPSWEIELGVVYENWSELPDPLVIDNLDMKVKLNSFGNESEETIEGPIELPNGYNNTFSFRLGTEWEANQNIQIRAGALYEQGGIPAQFVSVSSVDRDKIGIGLGGSYVVSSKLSFDIGVFQSFFGTWTVEDSEIRRLAAEIDIQDLSAELIEDRVVGNGTYSSSVFFGGMGATYNF